MKTDILKFLNIKDGFVSGEEISIALGVSRAAIWKHIKLLKEEGYHIEAVSRKGYRLISSPDLLTENEIKKYLNTSEMGQKIIYFDTLTSTNTVAKKLAEQGAEHGTIVVSEEQTSGRGRLGRNWMSPKYKGLWFSIILRPQLNPSQVAIITQLGAAAVIQAGLELALDFRVKWPNDIILNEKKICGILTEMSAEINQVHYIVLGIGINANLDPEDFPDELKEKASSIKIETGQQIDRKQLCGKIINYFESLYRALIRDGKGTEAIDICREKSILIGQEVQIIKPGKINQAIVLDLNDEGELVVKRENGELECLLSGEISVRGKRGYAI